MGGQKKRKTRAQVCGQTLSQFCEKPSASSFFLLSSSGRASFKRLASPERAHTLYLPRMGRSSRRSLLLFFSTYKSVLSSFLLSPTTRLEDEDTATSFYETFFEKQKNREKKNSFSRKRSLLQVDIKGTPPPPTPPRHCHAGGAAGKAAG